MNHFNLTNKQSSHIQCRVRRHYLPESYWRRFCPRCCHCEWSRCWLQHLFSWQRSWAANASAGCWPGWRSAGRKSTLSFFFDWDQCLLVPTVQNMYVYSGPLSRNQLEAGQSHFTVRAWKQLCVLSRYFPLYLTWISEETRKGVY